MDKKIKTGVKPKSGAAFSSIAVISGRPGSVFNSTVAKGIEDHAAYLGAAKKSVLYHTPRDSSAEACSAEIIDVLKQGDADGIICLGFIPDGITSNKLLRSGLPAVFIERNVKGFHSVKVDNFKGGLMAAEHLIKKGYKKTGFILDVQSEDEHSASFERYQGFLKMLSESGLKPVKGASVTVDRHNIENGRDAFEAFESSLKNVDSIFCVAGDMVAIGFMMEAKAGGIRIPDDFAIIGYDGIEASRAVSPALTTVRQPIETMGAKAVEIINCCLNGSVKTTVNICIDAQMSKGGTC